MTMVSGLMEFLEPDAVVLQSTAQTSEEIIRELAAKLEASGHVKPSYADAVVARERKLPTGLMLEGRTHVAIPHTDPEHVNKPGVAMATLVNPIAFANMEEPEQTVMVHVVFMLAINIKGKQIETLQAIIGAIQDDAVTDGLRRASSFDDVRVLFQPGK